MIELDLLYAVRGIVVVMMVGVMASLAFRWFKLRHVMPSSLKYTIVGIVTLLAAGIGNQAKFLRDGEEPSVMTWLSVVALVFFVVAQLEPWSSVVNRYMPQDCAGHEDDIRNLRVDRAELADRLYDSIRSENELSLEVMELRRQISVLKGEDKI